MNQHQLSVLVVDDESHVRQELRLFPWERYGARLVGEASNGKQALEQFERLNPDFLITDIEMPVLDGLELARTVRARKPGAQIAFLTCHDQFAYAQEGIELGVTGYLLKIYLEEKKLGCLIEKARQNIRRLTSADYLERELAHKRVERALQEATAGGKPDAAALRGEIVFPALVFALFYRQSADALGAQQRVESIAGAKLGYRAYRHVQNGYIVHFPGTMRPSQTAQKQEELLSMLGGGTRECGFCVSQACRVKQESEYFRFARESAKLVDAYFYAGAPLLRVGWRSGPAQAQDTVLLQAKEFLLTLHDNEEVNASLLERVRRACIESGISPVTFKMKVAEWIQSEFSGFDYVPFADKILASGTFDEVIALYTDCDGAYHSRLSKRFEVLQTLFFIKKHYAEPIRLSDAAQRLYLSANHLGKIFKKDMGKGFNEVLNETRIRAAIELLKNTNMKVYEIAGAVGIGSYRYFWNLFKEISGKQPSEFRVGTCGERDA